MKFMSELRSGLAGVEYLRAHSVDTLKTGKGHCGGFRGKRGCRGQGQPCTYEAGAVEVRGGSWNCPALTSTPSHLELRGSHSKPLVCLERGLPGPAKACWGGGQL